MKIEKITNMQLLNYGKQILEKMQDEHIAALKAEYETLGTEQDRSIERACSKQQVNIKQDMDDRLQENESIAYNWKKMALMVPLSAFICYKLTFKNPQFMSNLV